MYIVIVVVVVVVVDDDLEDVGDNADLHAFHQD